MFHNIRESRRKLFIVFITLTAIILIISVGFAALSATLNISTTNVTQTPQSWDVGFVPETVTAEENGTSSVGRICPTATATKSSITFGEMTLSKPEDGCAYTFTIRNNGTIDADLNSINFTDPLEESCTGEASSKTCGSISYNIYRKFNESDYPEILDIQNGYICSQDEYQIIVSIENSGNSLVTTETTQTNGKITLNFVQSNKDICEPYMGEPN